MRNQNTDILQGGMIMTAVLGNALYGVAEPGLINNFISLCCLPMMAAVTGFRMNLPKMERAGGLDLQHRFFPKLMSRVIKHWVVAFAVFTLLSISLGDLPEGIEQRFSLLNVIHHLFFPFNHIWFVSSISICMIINAVMFKLGVKGWQLFLYNTIIGLVLGCADTVMQVYQAPPILVRLPIFICPCILCYFGMGVASRRMIFDSLPIRHYPRRLAVLLGSICVGALLVASNILTEKGLEHWQLVLTWPLQFMLFLFFVSRFLSDAQDIYDEGRYILRARQRVELTDARETFFVTLCETLAFIGRNDVPMYLWHGLPIFILACLTNAGYISADLRLVIVLSLYFGWIALCIRLRNITKEL